MPSQAEIEAAAKAMRDRDYKDTKEWGISPPVDLVGYLEDAEAALTAAEKVREDEDTAESFFEPDKWKAKHEARTQPCPYRGPSGTCDGTTVNTFTHGYGWELKPCLCLSKPETGHEWTTNDEDAECRKCGKWKPETGRPNRYETHDPKVAYREGRKDALAEAKARVEAHQVPLNDPPSGAVLGYRSGITTALTAIDGSDDE